MIVDNCQWWTHLQPLELGFPFPLFFVALKAIQE